MFTLKSNLYVQTQNERDEEAIICLPIGTQIRDINSEEEYCIFEANIRGKWKVCTRESTIPSSYLE